MNFLSIKNLNKCYGNDTILQDVNLNVTEGEVAVLLGKSGSGKSTLLKCINQLVNRYARERFSHPCLNRLA